MGLGLGLGLGLGFVYTLLRAFLILKANTHVTRRIAIGMITAMTKRFHVLSSVMIVGNAGGRAGGGFEGWLGGWEASGGDCGDDCCTLP